jgi:hypothetical protein
MEESEPAASGFSGSCSQSVLITSLRGIAEAGISTRQKLFASASPIQAPLVRRDGRAAEVVMQHSFGDLRKRIISESIMSVNVTRARRRRLFKKLYNSDAARASFFRTTASQPTDGAPD